MYYCNLEEDQADKGTTPEQLKLEDNVSDNYSEKWFFIDRG